MACESTERLENVTLICRANVYFDGRVVSHTVLDATGRRTVGIIYPGSYTFNTDSAEKMEIVGGSCRVRVGRAAGHEQVDAGGFFRVPANSSFEIVVDSGLTEYICTFE